MDKIKVGDVLRLNGTEIIIRDIYLYKSHGGKYKTAIRYDHKDLESGIVTPDQLDVSLDWEGWEKV